MTPEQVAWVAGLLEGEGCFSSSGSACLIVKMTDRDTVYRLAEYTGAGTVRTVKVAGNRKPTWVWRVYRADDLRRIVAAVRPWLGERRTVAADALAARLPR